MSAYIRLLTIIINILNNLKSTKMRKITATILLFCISFLFIGLHSSAQGESSSGGESDAAKLAKETANPLADVISIPFQFNFNFGMGEYNRTQTLLNVMPAIPFRLNDKFNVLNRIILPVLIQPDISEESGSTFGLGSINYSMFFTPAETGKIIWGVGPAFNIPTRTNNLLGSPEFGIGPTLIVLTMPGNWALGLTVNNVWSYTNSNLNALFSQVFVVYTFPSAWFVQMMPTITANWNAEKGQKWSFPLGANMGKVVIFGKQPVKFIGGGSYYVLKPDAGPTWQLFAQVVLLFPKKKK